MDKSGDINKEQLKNMLFRAVPILKVWQLLLKTIQRWGASWDFCGSTGKDIINRGICEVYAN